jgi:hypothetical protein
MARNYKREYANYQGKPEQIKRRSSRNKARRELMKLGVVKKGDGKDVDHINSNPLNNEIKNLRAKSKRANRSFPRTKTAREKR